MQDLYEYGSVLHSPVFVCHMQLKCIYDSRNSNHTIVQMRAIQSVLIKSKDALQLFV